LWLHNHLGVRALPLFAVLAAVTDVARLGLDLPYVGWLNLVFVWGLAHQAGFHYSSLLAAPRRVLFALVTGGLAGLVGLVGLAGYPGSLVGVPGDRWSNMAPPTLAIVALVAVQAGLVGLLRPSRLPPVPAWLNRYALGLFLLHSTGMALYRYASWLVTGDGLDRTPPDLGWWLHRPVAVAGALLCTLPLLYAFARWQGRSAPLPPPPHVHGEYAAQPRDHTRETGPQPTGVPVGGQVVAEDQQHQPGERPPDGAAERERHHRHFERLGELA
jgi:hypothetical protein